MIRDIVQKGEEILTRESQEIRFFERNGFCREIVRDLIDTILAQLSKHNFGRGIGLAAPQIGVSKRIFVVQLPEKEKLRVFINPRIICYSREVNVEYEGCLSFFGVRGKVERASEITINYIDEDERGITESYRLFDARLLQHEFDHLGGILYIDRMKPEEDLITYEEYVDNGKWR